MSPDLQEKQIGLCRHLAVPDISPWSWMSQKDFQAWARDNDSARPLSTEGLEPLPGWDTCLASDLPRAAKSAEALAGGIPVKQYPSLREVPFSRIPSPAPLPKGFFLFLSRLAWFFNLGNSEGRNGTFQRAEQAARFMDGLPQPRVLAVTHGFFMHALASELRRLGYSGRIPVTPEYGRVYVFSRKKKETV
jgi:broad specificity phosphatase PhoE